MSNNSQQFHWGAMRRNPIALLEFDSWFTRTWTFSSLRFAMKLSENQNYMDHAKARAFGNLDESERFLQACIAEAHGPSYERAFLLTQMGSLKFEQGQRDESLRWYEEAEAVDAASLLPVLFYAEFLAHRFGDVDASLKKCDRILDETNAYPFEATDEELGSEYYQRKALEIREFCLSKGAKT